MRVLRREQQSTAMRPSVSIVIGVALLLVVVVVIGTEARRGRRSTLAFPSKTACTVTFDLSVPINTLATSGAYYNMKLPFRFFIPTVEELTNPSDRTGEDDADMEDNDQQRSHEERRFIYKSIESMISSFGFDGLACLQRTICELSDAPIAHNDMLGSVLNLLFTPPRASEGGHNGTITALNGETCDTCQIMNEPYHDDYVQAYHHGKEGRCATQYGLACPVSFWNMMEL